MRDDAFGGGVRINWSGFGFILPISIFRIFIRETDEGVLPHLKRLGFL